MNMTALQNAEIIAVALARFGELTGLRVTQEVLEGGPDPQPDALIKLVEGERHWTYLVACRTLVDRVATLHAVQERIRDFPGEGILIAPHLTADLAMKCQEMGLPFMDAAGNAFLKQKGLHIQVGGLKLDKALFRAEKPMRAFDRTGLRVVFALLVDPDLLQAPYRSIAKAAGVALGTVGWILTNLRENGFLVEDRQGNRRWIDQTRAIQAWATNFPLRLRERLRPRRFTAKEPDWWRNATPEIYGGCWGGEVGVAKLEGDLVPKTVTLYLPEGRNEFLAKYRLRADPQGLVEVLDAFWDLPPVGQIPVGIAPPLLIYADLQGIGDPRTLEQAKVIYDRYLA